MAKEPVDWIEDRLRLIKLERLMGHGCKALDEVEDALTEAIPSAAAQPPETRVLKRNGRQTRFKIDGKPARWSSLWPTLRAKGWM